MCAPPPVPVRLGRPPDLLGHRPEGGRQLPDHLHVEAVVPLGTVQADDYGAPPAPGQVDRADQHDGGGHGGRFLGGRKK